jgi:hypothetical protein
MKFFFKEFQIIYTPDNWRVYFVPKEQRALQFSLHLRNDKLN